MIYKIELYIEVPDKIPKDSQGKEQYLHDYLYRVLGSQNYEVVKQIEYQKDQADIIANKVLEKIKDKLN
jgi:hypothetical protein